MCCNTDTQNISYFGNLNLARVVMLSKWCDHTPIPSHSLWVQDETRPSRGKHHRIHAHCGSQKVCSKPNGKCERRCFNAIQCCHRTGFCSCFCQRNVSCLWPRDGCFSFWWPTWDCDIWFTDVLSAHSITWFNKSSIHLHLKISKVLSV